MSAAPGSRVAAQGGWCEQTAQGTLLRLLIQPKASRSGIVGLHGEPPRLKVRIAAPPVEGQANEELLRFLKKELRGLAHGVELVRGDSSKTKDVLCVGANADALRAHLISRSA